MTSLTANPHPPGKIFFLRAIYQTVCVFWNFRWVARANRSGDIHAQSHVRL